MTARPAFFPIYHGVRVEDARAFEFSWNPGFAFSQKQKNVRALHEAIMKVESGCRPLEISSKSTEELGMRLSAFNLSVPYKSGSCSVETAFQASKVFQNSGPFPEMYGRDSREVRDFVRGEPRGALIAFEANGVRWGLNPTRAFYDWVYIKALLKNPELAEALVDYDCFTDIEFNPKKSLNCQAYAVALYLSLRRAGVLQEAMTDRDSFLRFHPKDVVVVGRGVNIHKTRNLEQGTFGF